MSATELRIAVVGTGGRSRAQCRALSAAEGATLGAVCDVVPERAASAAEEFGADAPNV
jgi:predicted dehydrogenase